MKEQYNSVVLSRAMTVDLLQALVHNNTKSCSVKLVAKCKHGNIINFKAVFSMDSMNCVAVCRWGDGNKNVKCDCNFDECDFYSIHPSNYNVYHSGDKLLLDARMKRVKLYINTLELPVTIKDYIGRHYKSQYPVNKQWIAIGSVSITEGIDDYGHLVFDKVDVENDGEFSFYVFTVKNGDMHAFYPLESGAKLTLFKAKKETLDTFRIDQIINGVLSDIQMTSEEVGDPEIEKIPVYELLEILYQNGISITPSVNSYVSNKYKWAEQGRY